MIYLNRITQGSGQCKVRRAFDIVLVTSGLPVFDDILSEGVVEGALKMVSLEIQDLT